MAHKQAECRDGSFASRLARFFPDATPVRIPVQVTRKGGGQQDTVIEFGTPREVLFVSSLPLEFADKIHLQNSDRSLDTEAWVVAVQCQSGNVAVAARFAHDLPNWIIKQ
ncbi:MAG TPA: hypothetical protein VFA76_01470 [Terriglobales bacterium]|nr:hypothetical protein [Terriglobales bacterium]